MDHFMICCDGRDMLAILEKQLQLNLDAARRIFSLSVLFTFVRQFSMLSGMFNVASSTNSIQCF